MLPKVSISVIYLFNMYLVNIQKGWEKDKRREGSDPSRRDTGPRHGTDALYLGGSLKTQ